MSESKPHIVKAILIYSDGRAVELTYKEMVCLAGGKGPVTPVSLMFGIFWGGLEALGYMKRKEMGRPCQS